MLKMTDSVNADHQTLNCDSNKNNPVHRGWHSRGYLPHFDSPFVIQHITYRLAGALPRMVLEKMRAETTSLPLEEMRQKTELRRKIETYLDAGYGCCILSNPEIASCIVDTWLRFDGERYRLLSWMVMPNHCHVLIEPFQNISLAKIVLSWKNYTARFINSYKCGTGTYQSRKAQNPVWQRDYWDRFVRDEYHFAAIKKYIHFNPVNAGLVEKPEKWPWSSAAWKEQRI